MTQVAFGLRAQLDDVRPGERREAALVVFQLAFKRGQWPAGDAALVASDGRKLGEQAAQLEIVENVARQLDVAAELQARKRIAAKREARTAGREGDIARLDVGRGMAQIVRRGVERLAVGVDAQIGDIEAGVRKMEIVDVAAEIGDRVLGNKHQADVVVDAVAVEIVQPAAMQIDDFAADVGLAADTFAVDDCTLGEIGGIEVGPVFAGGDAVDAFGHVGDGERLVEFEPGAFELVASLLGIETGRRKILLCVREALDAARYAMVVGQHQAMRRDEARRAMARDAQRRQPDVIEPGLIGPEAVGLLDLVGRKMVEQPHAFVGEACGRRQRHGNSHGGGKTRSKRHGRHPRLTADFIPG